MWSRCKPCHQRKHFRESCRETSPMKACGSCGNDLRRISHHAGAARDVACHERTWFNDGAGADADSFEDGAVRPDPYIVFDEDGFARDHWPWTLAKWRTGNGICDPF